MSHHILKGDAVDKIVISFVFFTYYFDKSTANFLGPAFIEALSDNLLRGLICFSKSTPWIIRDFVLDRTTAEELAITANNIGTLNEFVSDVSNYFAASAACIYAS